jgi:hypothetical protein
MFDEVHSYVEFNTSKISLFKLILIIFICDHSLFSANFFFFAKFQKKEFLVHLFAVYFEICFFINIFKVGCWGGEPCADPAISHDSQHVSLVQWTNLFDSRLKGHRFKSPGGTYVKPGFSCL